MHIGAKATTATHSCAAVTPCQVANTGDASSAMEKGAEATAGSAEAGIHTTVNADGRLAGPDCLRSGGPPNAVSGRRPLRRRPGTG